MAPSGLRKAHSGHSGEANSRLVGWPFSSSRAGSASHEPWLRVELEDPPKVFFDVASDTCLADVGRAGVGGFYHGLFWFYKVPEDVRFYLLPVSSVGPAKPGRTGPTCASLYARTPSLQRSPLQRAPLTPRSRRIPRPSPSPRTPRSGATPRPVTSWSASTAIMGLPAPRSLA